MKKYLCDICKNEHPVYYGSKSPIPQFVTELIKSKDENRLIQLTKTAFIVVDTQKFITQGLLGIDTNFSSEQIHHYPWIEISASDFKEKMELLVSGITIKLKGELISQVPFFKDLHGLLAELTINPDNLIGQIKILSESQAKKDQQRPISKERFIEMMQRINHPELWKGKAVFDKSFRERLSEMIDYATKDYRLKGKNFVIEINNQREKRIQLISSELLVTPSNKGIGIHISNDETNLNYKVIERRMADLCQKILIKKFLWNEIETYQKEYEIENDRLYWDIKQIIQDVYEENVEEMELYIFEP